MADEQIASTASSERGLPILRDTGCKVGEHIFVWSGVGHSSDQPPDPSLPCICGLTTYGKAGA